jgi:hypothetical protein
MNLGKHIHTLLKRQTEVYVAGLGVFKRVYNPATFDAQKNVFMPPISYIEFDSTATAGYDFVSYLQQLEQIDRRDAENIVAQHVSELQAELHASGEVSLDGLGQLVSYGNTAIFKPFDLSGFNFEPIETSIPHENTAVDEELPITEDHSAVTAEESIAEAPISDETPSEIIEATPIAESVPSEDFEPVVPSEEEQPSSNRTSLYALVAVLAVAILGGLYYYTQHYQTAPTAATEPLQDTTTQELATPIITSNTDSLATQDTALAVIDTLETATDEIPKATVEEMPVTENKKFTIVIGTHRNLAQAYEEAEAFHKDGHASVRVITPNLAKNLKRVIWDTYATKAERDSALRYVRKHIKAESWGDMLK